MLDIELQLQTGMNSDDLLLSLEIETCFKSAKSLYSEVYKMPDGTGRLYWIYSLALGQLLQFINSFCKRHSIPKKIALDAVFKHPYFLAEYHQLNPVKLAYIPKEEIQILSQIISKGLPENVEFPHGADGLEYYLKTYGIANKKYSAWVVIPKEWTDFAELIKILITNGCWSEQYNCRISSGEKSEIEEDVSSEIPPWVKKNGMI